MKTIVLATKNQGKVRELREIFAGLPYEIVTMQDAGIHIDVVEDGKTFEENAMKKAREIHALSGNLVIADDSGLEVDALGGAPGIFSARYGGGDLDDAGRVQLLLQNLQGVPKEARTARFVCAAAFVTDEESFVVRSTLEGLIADRPTGNGGFGYDPVLYIPLYQKTVAELSAEVKNAISHRGKAMLAVRQHLEAQK